MKRRLCPFHRSVYRTLRHRLGRAHHGRRTARRTLTQISRACPTCPKETA